MINPNNIGYVIVETATVSEDAPAGKLLRRRNGRIVAEGILQEANMKNRNGRWYDDKELFPELTAPRQLELLRTGNMRGENGHPLDKDLARQQTIDPNNCVCIYTKFWTEGNFVKGEFFGTFNEKGEEFDHDLEAGFFPSFSLRALGSVVNTSRGAEVRNIKIITYDRVIYPSHNKAYTTGIVSESAAAASNNKLILSNNDKGIIFPITNESVINYIKSESANLKRIKESFDFMYNDIEIVNNASQVKLTGNDGSIFVVNLENYISNEIMDACTKL